VYVCVHVCMNICVYMCACVYVCVQLGFPYSKTDTPLFLTPVGRECDPKYLTRHDMTTAIKKVLGVLDELHKMEWCHCDVRWPNVIFDVKENNFVLIDFGYARKIGDKCPNIKKEFIHEELSKNGNWQVFGDTHQVVLMIQRWMEAHEDEHDDLIQVSKTLSGKHKWESKELLELLEGVTDTTADRHLPYTPTMVAADNDSLPADPSHPLVVASASFANSVAIELDVKDKEDRF